MVKKKDTNELISQRGSILIGIIVTMVIMSALGAGMLYMTTTSTYNELIYGSHSNAYYVAEAGGRYAMTAIRDAYATSTTDLREKLEKKFRMGDGRSFEIKNVAFDGGNPETVSFVSVGTVGSGFMTANRQIQYSISPANQSKGGRVTEFTVKEMDPTNSRGKFVTEGDAIKVQQTVSDGNNQWMAASYFKSSINFLQERDAQLDFLSYDAQVKVKSDVEYFLAGLGFRLHTVRSRPRGFHVSFMRFRTFGTDDGIPADMNPYELKIRGMERDKYYIILWMDDLAENISTDGKSRIDYETLLAYKKLDSSFGIFSETASRLLTPWSTLLVNLEEKNITPGNNDSRRNVIKVYYSAPDDNPKGAINWPPAQGMNLVHWDWVTDDKNVVATESNTVVQTKYYRTANGTPPSDRTGWYNVTDAYDEIGLSVFGVNTGRYAVDNHVFFDDCVIKIGSDAGSSDGSGIVIQY
jgi:hypothetical protein